jgi:hypothetical protein
LVSPVLEPGVTTVSALFPPQTTWYDVRTGTKTISSTDKQRSVTLNAPLDGVVPLHLRAGRLVPLFATPPEPAMTIHELSSRRKFGFMVALGGRLIKVGDKSEASGSLFIDQDSLGLDDTHSSFDMMQDVHVHMEKTVDGWIVSLHGRVLQQTGTSSMSAHLSEVRVLGWTPDTTTDHNGVAPSLLIQDQTNMDNGVGVSVVQVTVNDVAVSLGVRMLPKETFTDFVFDKPIVDLTLSTWSVSIRIE